MSGKSFFDLDYIIEINEKRLEQYTDAYDKVMEKLTNIIVIYAAMAIFLIPIVRMVFWDEKQNWLLMGCFGLFAVLFTVSAIFSVRLILPNVLPLVGMPQKYYVQNREKYEQEINDQMAIENILRANYISELELLTGMYLDDLKRKTLFYRYALVFALLSILPYLGCFGFYIANQKDDFMHRIEKVN